MPRIAVSAQINQRTASIYMSGRDRWSKLFEALLFPIALATTFITFRPQQGGPWEQAWMIDYYETRVKEWLANKADFRQFISRKYEAIKLLATGHASGLFAIALFLYSAKPVGFIAILAKACWLIFGIGAVLSSLAYWQLFQFEADAERAFDVSGEDSRLPWDTRSQCRRLAYRNSIIAYLNMNMIVYFAVGGMIVFFGVLLHKWG